MFKIISAETRDAHFGYPPAKRACYMPYRPPGGSFFQQVNPSPLYLPRPTRLSQGASVESPSADPGKYGDYIAHGNFMDVYKGHHPVHGNIVRKTFTTKENTHFRTPYGKDINTRPSHKLDLINRAYTFIDYMNKGSVPVVPILNEQADALKELMIESPYIDPSQLLSKADSDTQAEVVTDILLKVIQSWVVDGVKFYFPDVFETDNIVMYEGKWTILDVVDDHDQEGFEFVALLKQMHRKGPSFTSQQIDKLKLAAETTFKELEEGGSNVADEVESVFSRLSGFFS